MSLKTSRLLTITISIAAIACRQLAQGSLTLVGSGNVTGPNLVANGSFETGQPNAGTANLRYWASGTPYTPFLAIPSWTGSGPSDNYALWGSDETTGPFHLRGSDLIPDGRTAVYFGNGEQRSVDRPPTFNPDYSVTFNSTPTFGGFNYTGPVVLSQMIPTDQNPAPSYGMSFWVSGEFADTSTATTPGIFGLRLSNTDPNNPMLYFVVPPGANSSFGKSHVFRFDFTPLNNTQPVTLEFFNFGHTGYGFPATEMVLDDVRVTAVPEPAIFALLGVGLVLCARRRLTSEVGRGDRGRGGGRLRSGQGALQQRAGCLCCRRVRRAR